MAGCRTRNFSALTVLVVSVMVFASFVVFSDSSDADSLIVVADGKGNTFEFDYVPDHIATIGVGITVSAVQLGVLDKIVVADNYSNKNTSDILKDFRQYVSEGKIAAHGNIYSSGLSDLKNDLVNAADTAMGGVFDKEKDVIFITGSDTYLKNIVPELTERGFKKILQWNSITEYSDIVSFVKTISLVTLGSEHKIVTQMTELTGYIADKLGVREKVEAFYVTYSGGTFKVGNTGSLANSMITVAGGSSITTDSSKSSPTYETNLTQLMENHPGAIIFVDNSIAGNTSYLNQLKTQVGSYATMVKLDSMWNNFSTESMNGVWTMACALYPDLFSGDVPYADGYGEENTVIYLGAGLFVAGIITVGGVFFLRTH